MTEFIRVVNALVCVAAILIAGGVLIALAGWFISVHDDLHRIADALETLADEPKESEVERG